ncbi:hypothetical protein PGTUg99_000353 [Puccinia graminis f. sp. tritici]|uniref:Uncharacterized protein n=1 Tax=Puccinia graminis f. sp. tritici TaxID=56615 RepID=A0A5B0PTC9_PUCGR|nr:hypothetical protein PGTUg99_000353 [Puccinia graminis f. sp. tritici]
MDSVQQVPQLIIPFPSGRPPRTDLSGKFSRPRTDFVWQLPQPSHLWPAELVGKVHPWTFRKNECGKSSSSKAVRSSLGSTDFWDLRMPSPTNLAMIGAVHFGSIRPLWASLTRSLGPMS